MGIAARRTRHEKRRIFNDRRRRYRNTARNEQGSKGVISAFTLPPFLPGIPYETHFFYTEFF